jgi:hypothetical protein
MPSRLALLFAFLAACTGDPPPPGPYDDDYDGFDSDEDCDDHNSFVFPGAPELCDERDNDCDGDVDEDVETFPEWMLDEDGDGYGGEPQVTGSCDEPPNAVDVGGDCDDGNAAAYPGAPETCDDTTDLNCDGADPHDDNDEDGFIACMECDDFDETRYPKAPEYCDGDDDDCDGTTDEDPVDGTEWYPDADGDGYGVDGTPSEPECNPPPGYGEGTDDCDDDDKLTYPGAEEQCDGLDNDCDEVIPSDESDEDGDGYDICADQDCDDDDPKVGPDGDTDTDGTVDCYDPDDDGDDLLDTDEVAGTSGWVTDPKNADTDDDGADDGEDAAPLHDVCSTDLFFYDDFTSNPALSGWDEAAGIWSWDGDTYYMDQPNSFALAWLPDYKKDFEDVVVNVVMQPDNDVYDAGVMFRVFPDPGYGDTTGSYYFLMLDPGADTVVLTYWVLGLLTPLDQVDLDIDADKWYEVTIRADGGSLEVAVDGDWILSATDKNLTVGSVGFRTSYSQATYDEILVCW